MNEKKKNTQPHYSTIGYLQEIHFRFKYINGLKSRDVKRYMVQRVTKREED